MGSVSEHEDLSHTLRFMRCNRCGNVFVTSIGGYVECPECSLTEAAKFNPDESDDTLESENS